MACERFDFNTQVCLDIKVGLDYSAPITYTEQATGDPIDLTGSTLTMRIKENADDVADVLTLTNSATTTVTGLYIPTPTSGQFTIIIINADTSTLEDQTYLYDIIIEDGSGLKTLFLEGDIQASKGIITI